VVANQPRLLTVFSLAHVCEPTALVEAAVPLPRISAPFLPSPTVSEKLFLALPGPCPPPTSLLPFSVSAPLFVFAPPPASLLQLPLQPDVEPPTLLPWHVALRLLRQHAAAARQLQQLLQSLGKQTC